MANNYEQIKALVDAGNKMGLSNTITRDNGIPLDYSSVQPSYEEAVVYAATKSIAYHGQPLAVITDTDATLYVITPVSQGKLTVGETEYDVYLKPVGTKTLGDDASISLSEDGVLSLYGFGSAPAETLPQKQADGTIRWVPISAIVEGDGNSVTTVRAADASVSVVNQVFGGYVPGEEHSGNCEPGTYIVEISGLDYSGEITVVYVDNEGGEGYEQILISNNGRHLVEVRELDEGESHAYITCMDCTIDKIYTAVEFEGNKYDLKVNHSSTEGNAIELKQDGLYVKDLSGDIQEVSNAITDLKGGSELTIKGLDDKIIAEADRADKAEKKALEDAKAYTDEEITKLDLANKLSENLQSAKTYTDEEIDKIEDAISKLNHFTTKIVTSTAEVTEEGVLYLIKSKDVEGKDNYDEYLFVGGKAVLIGDTSTDLSDYYTKSEVYTKGEVDGLIEGVNGSIGEETEAREALAERVKALEDVDNVTEAEFTERKAAIDKAIEDAEAAAIKHTDDTLAVELPKKLDKATYEADKPTFALKSEVTETLKNYSTTSEVNKAIGDAVSAESANLTKEINAAKESATAAGNAASAAQETANTANGKADTNALAIKAVSDIVKGEDGVSGLVKQVSTIENSVGTLSGTVEEHGTHLGNIDTALSKKAEQSSLNATNERVLALEGVVGDANSGLVKTVGNASSGLVKDVADNKQAILDEKDRAEAKEAELLGKINAIDFVDEQELEDALDLFGENYVDRAIEEVINNRIDLLDNADTGRVTIAEQEIDALQETIKGLSGAMHFKGVVTTDPTADSFVTEGYAIGDVVIFGNKEYVFAEVTVGEAKANKFVEFGDATGNASAISALNEKVDTGDKKVSEYVADEIEAKKYVLPAATAAALGGIKSSDKFVVTEGVVTSISTDLLVQGSKTLILNAGEISVTNA